MQFSDFISFISSVLYSGPFTASGDYRGEGDLPQSGGIVSLSQGVFNFGQDAGCFEVVGACTLIFLWRPWVLSDSRGQPR